MASPHIRDFVLSIKIQRSFLIRAWGKLFPEPITTISLTLVTGAADSRQAWEKHLQPQPSHISVTGWKVRENKDICPFTHQVLVGGESEIGFLPLCFSFWREKTSHTLLTPFPTVPRGISPFSAQGIRCFSVSCRSQYVLILLTSCALPYIYRCSHAPQCQQENRCTRPFSYRVINARFWQPTSELLREPQEIVKSCPGPTRWHCVWLLPALPNLRQSLAWAQQLQSQLRGFDFQHKSLGLEPHPAVPPVQQLLGSLSHSKLVVFQIITSILYFFSQEAPRLYFSSSWILPKTFQRFQEIFRKSVSLSILSGWCAVRMWVEGYKLKPSLPEMLQITGILTWP